MKGPARVHVHDAVSENTVREPAAVEASDARRSMELFWENSMAGKYLLRLNTSTQSKLSASINKLYRVFQVMRELKH